MRDELLLYYEQELTYLRQNAAQFAEKYPKIASRLSLEPDKCEDPHVERMLEAFALLAARVHMKIDSEFPEITQSLLDVVYPHFLRPIPSMSIAEFFIDPAQGKLTAGLNIPRESVLQSRPVSGVPCKFRTAYETTIWPLSVAAAEWTAPDRLAPPVRSPESVGAVRVEIACNRDVRFADLRPDRLRFHVNGEGRMAHKLYELLSSRLNRIVARAPGGTRAPAITLPATALQPVGFAEDEAILPYPRRSFQGYRLIQEYFAFPEKFFFFDLTGLAEVWDGHPGDRIEFIFMISGFEGADSREMLELGVSARTFRLACTPIVNLFPQAAEPVLLSHQKFEYPVTPDVRRPYDTEIFSIDRVSGINLQTREETEYQPFYAFRHSADGTQPKAFWTASRRDSLRPNDTGTDTYIALLNLSMQPVQPNADTLTVYTTCTNRDLPSRLPFDNEAGDFQLEGVTAIKKIVALRKPTVTLRPPLGKDLQWRLVSHLSLNYLSLVEEGREALQQILKLYNYGESPSVRKMIEGLTRLESRSAFCPVATNDTIAFARGTRIEIEFDEEQFVGGGVYLFAAVLERFLSSYASLNSFTQLAVRTKQRKELLREWAPRAGQQILV
jgi:type VI secretion system protein ImpG